MLNNKKTETTKEREQKKVEPNELEVDEETSDDDEERSSKENGDDSSDEDEDVDKVDKNLNVNKLPLSNEDILNNKRLQKGKIFANYEEFTEQFDLFCKETYQLFVIAKSEKIDKENIKFREFKCIHHEAIDKKVTRGENVYKLQSYNGCSCKSTFRINFNQRGPHAGLYKITTMVIDHNHETTQKDYLLNHSNRKLSNDLKETAK